MRKAARTAVVAVVALTIPSLALSSPRKRHVRPSGKTGEAGGRCRSSETTVRLDVSSEAMFHLQASYLVTNVGRIACSLRGFPLVTPYHESQTLPSASTRVQVHAVDTGNPHRIVLGPGQRAGFVVRFLADSSRVAPCPSTWFDLRLPGQPQIRVLTPDQTFPVCPAVSYADPLIISAIEPFSQIPHPARKTRPRVREPDLEDHAPIDGQNRASLAQPASCLSPDQAKVAGAFCATGEPTER